MLAVICMTLLFSVMGGTGGTQETTTGNYTGGWSITFNKKELTSEAGLCIVIPCSFTHSATFKPTTAIWLKCESEPTCGATAINDVIFNSKKPRKPPFSFRKRVALLEPSFTLRKNCSITINELTESDTGSYQFRVEGTSTAKPAGDGYTFALKKTLMVTSLKQKPQVKVPPALTEGQQTTLTCTAPGLCSGAPPNFTWTWRKTGHKDSLITSNDTILKTENQQRVNQGHSSNLTFTPSSEHDGSQVTCQVTFKGNITAMETVTLNVTYLKEPKIRGNTTVEEGGTLNLTCDVENSPPSTTVIWTDLDSNKTLVNGTESANPIIRMVTGEHSGRYSVSCTAKHLNKTLTTVTNITVMTIPVILNGSECVHSLRLGTHLICVCISQGFPLPTITWQVENRSGSYFMTVVNFTTVKSTMTVEDHYYNTSVKCFSKGYGTTVNKTLIIKKDEQEGQNEGFFLEVKTIIAFLIGVTLSMTICCLATACHRCTKKNSRDQAEVLQMVTCQDQQTGGGQGVEDGHEQTPQRETLEGGGEAERDQNRVVPKGEVKEVDYANIDYSKLRQRSAEEEAEHKRETAETEYAEVKREGDKKQNSGTEDSGTVEREDEEEAEAMIGQHEKRGHCGTEEEEGEDTALYSNVKAIMLNSGAPDSSVNPQGEVKEEEEEEVYANYSIDYSQLRQRSAEEEEAEHKRETTETYAEVNREGNKKQNSGAEDSWTVEREDEEEAEAMIGQHEERGHSGTDSWTVEREDEDEAEAMIRQHEERGHSGTDSWTVEREDEDEAEAMIRQHEERGHSGTDSWTVEREDEEEAEAMIGQHEKRGHCGTEEEEGEDTALYSNLKAIMLNSGAPDSSVSQGEVKEEEEEVYANYSIDHSQLRQRSAEEEEAKHKRETTETYAEVNREGNKKQNSGAEDSWTVEREDEEEAEAMIGQHEKRGHCGTDTDSWTVEREDEAEAEAMVRQHEERGHSGTDSWTVEREDEEEAEAMIRQHEERGHSGTDSWTVEREDEEAEAMIRQHDQRGHCGTEEEEDDYGSLLQC